MTCLAPPNTERKWTLVDTDGLVSLAETHVNFGGDTVGGRAGQRVTTERAGVVPGLEDVRSILAKHSTYRNASTKRLGQLTWFADWCVLLPLKRLPRTSPVD